MSMKPIDIQNATLLALLRTSGTPSRITLDLRHAGYAVAGYEVTRALETLRRDGLAQILTEEHPAGGVSQPVYSLTAAGIVEARTLPGGSQ
ncbi:hypothetical protein [Modicisalibacter coralii]|uniref:hypothetical protein n=1 Tax=Modicisalibacter coralii TaxID=2304602 RepID=UPI00100B9A25|nr:hypothetical protein [Halomonas coralii]